MKTYKLLSCIPAIKNKFTLKILFVAFVGIHVPLFAIIAYLSFSKLDAEDAWTIALLTLGFTLLATLITLFVLNSLLKPVMRAKQALNKYIKFAKVSDLPMNYTDEAGVLMHDVQTAINALEAHEERKLASLQLLSHDLQSPLRTTLGILDFIKEEKDPEFVKEHHLLIEESLQNQLSELEQVLSDLKKRRKTAEEHAEFEEIEMDKLWSDLQKRFSFALEKKNLRLQIASDVNQAILPLTAVQKSLNNIMSNAIKFSEEAGTLKLNCSKQNRNEIHISLKDEGKGFNPSDVAKIFQYDLSLAELSEVKESHSNGIGLSLCQTLMNNVGGEIIAQSEGPGKGATFTLVVPIKTSVASYIET